MKLRTVSFSFILIVSLLLVSTIYLGARFFVVGRFYDLEKDMVARNIERAAALLSTEVSSLRTLARDWAWWDDTYEFAADKNQEYFDSNLSKLTMEQLDLDMLLIIGPDGKIVWGATMDRNEGQLGPIVPGLLSMVTGEGPLSVNSSVRRWGYAKIGSGLVMLAAPTILTSKNRGPARGVLAMGKFVTQSMLSRLKKQVKMDFSLTSLDSMEKDRKIEYLLANPGHKSKPFITVLDNGDIEGSVLVNGIGGRPLFVLNVVQSRGFFNQALTAINKLVLFFVIAALATTLLTAYFVDSWIVGRIRSLAFQLKARSAKPDSAGTIVVDGQDELSDLAHAINASLDKLGSEKRMAEAANQSKGKFLVRMSHEIRTPLKALMGMRGLLSEADLDGNQKKFLNIFNKSGETLIRVIDDIIEISSLDSGRVLLDRAKFSIPEMVHELEEEFKPMAMQKGLVFDARIAPRVPEYVIGDCNRLKQLLGLLLDNAVKFTRKGQVALQVESSSADQELLFVVWDTGIGIDALKQEAVFRSFTQLPPKGGEGRGTGMGLAIAKRLVKLLRGGIWLSSRPGTGSTFSFSAYLPAAGAEDLAVKRDCANGLEILVVDDNENNRNLMELYLKDTPYKLHVAVDGRQAYDLVRHKKYGVVFMDMQMPVMDGFESTRLIRQWEKENNETPVPIVALTGTVEEKDKERCLEAGCSEFMVKPLKKQFLLDYLDKIADMATVLENG